MDQTIFTRSGCLTADALEQVAKGRLSGSLLSRAQEHLDICPLCSESLDGLKVWLNTKEAEKGDAMPDPPDKSRIKGQPVNEIAFASRVHQLNRHVQKRLEVHHQVQTAHKSRVLKKPFAYVTIAASLILFLGIYYLVREKPHVDNPVAVVQPAPVSTASPDLQKKDTIVPALPKTQQSSGTAKKSITLVDNDVEIEADQAVVMREEDTFPMPTNRNVSDVVVVGFGIPRKRDSAPYPVNSEVVPQIDGIRVTEVVSDEESKAGMFPQEEVFTTVEQIPRFEGGEDELRRFLERNLRYPAAAREGGVEGTVYVSFIVEVTGKITDIRLTRGIGGGCDDEALRVVRLMPEWTPGRQNGLPVRTRVQLPVSFRLNNQ